MSRLKNRDNTVEKQRRIEQPVNRGTIKSEDVSSLISDLKNSLQEVKKEKEKMEVCDKNHRSNDNR